MSEMSSDGDPWGREALRVRLGVSDEALLGAALDFARESLEASPWRRFAGLFDSRDPKVVDRLGECFLDGLACFRSDLARFRMDPATTRELFEAVLLTPTLGVVWCYRTSRALFLAEVTHERDVLFALGRFLSGVEIYYSADIGPGLKLIHGLGTVIGAACTVGSQFTIYQGATLGDKLGRGTGPRPRIGDRVILSTGAQVLGGVEIGSETVVGAKAVVLHSLPARCVAAGTPARPRKTDLSDEDFAVFWNALKG